jgi:DNA-binding transcriptional ArsR family regulator
MKKLEKTIKAFGNVSRLKILQYLKKNKFASVTNIAEGTKCSYKATSKHLAILFQADIVDREQVAYEMHYKLSDDTDSATETLLKLI